MRRTVGCARSGGSGESSGAINGIYSPATAHRKPSSNSLSACAQKFEVPRWAINRRVAMFGLARIKELERNPAEAIGKLWSRSETRATSSIAIELAEQRRVPHCQQRTVSAKSASPVPDGTVAVRLSQPETIARNEPYKDSTAATNANDDEPERP